MPAAATSAKHGRNKPPIGTSVGSDRSAAQELLSQFAPRKQHQLQGQQGLDNSWLRSILNAFCCEKNKFVLKRITGIGRTTHVLDWAHHCFPRNRGVSFQTLRRLGCVAGSLQRRRRPDSGFARHLSSFHRDWCIHIIEVPKRCTVSVLWICAVDRNRGRRDWIDVAV